MVKVSGKLYNAALPFAGLKDVRSYLNGVRVEPAPCGQGVLLVAINGHVACVIHDPDGSCEEAAIMPRIKAPKAGVIEFDGLRATFADGGSVPAQFVEGRYVDWQAIVPHKPDKAMGDWLDCRYVELFAKLGSTIADSKFCGMAIAGEPRSGALVTFAGASAFGVIMPMRMDGVLHTIPSFMRRP